MPTWSSSRSASALRRRAAEAADAALRASPIWRPTASTGLRAARRVLEDHGDATAADVFEHGRCARRSSSLPVEPDRAAARARLRRQQPEGGQPGHALARAGFADEAQRLAAARSRDRCRRTARGDAARSRPLRSRQPDERGRSCEATPPSVHVHGAELHVLDRMARPSSWMSLRLAVNWSRSGAARCRLGPRRSQITSMRANMALRLAMSVSTSQGGRQLVHLLVGPFLPTCCCWPCGPCCATIEEPSDR